MLAVQVYRPELLPDALRPKPRIQTVEVRTPAPSPVPSAQYVALLQRDGGSPAFILTVDAATKNFTVRKVGADAEPGKSFELWLISDKLPQPRSLGVIGGSDFTARPVLADYDAGTINAATYAVTVEPAGGSPSGKPTSAPIYIGKLIETVPGSLALVAAMVEGRGHPSRRAVLRMGLGCRCQAQRRSPQHKRKRPWGAGVSVVNLGVVGVLIIHVATLGGYKEPREFREFSFSVRQCCLNS